MSGMHQTLTRAIHELKLTDDVLTMTQPDGSQRIITTAARDIATTLLTLVAEPVELAAVLADHLPVPAGQDACGRDQVSCPTCEGPVWDSRNFPDHQAEVLQAYFLT